MKLLCIGGIWVAKLHNIDFLFVKLKKKSYSNSKMKQRPIVGLFIFYEIKQINDETSSNKNDPICFIFEVFSSVRVVVSDPILLVKNQNVMTMILIDGRWERFSLPFGWNSLYSNRVVNYRKRYLFRDFYCQVAHFWNLTLKQVWFIVGYHKLNKFWEGHIMHNND